MAEQAYVFDLRKIAILKKGVWCQYPYQLNLELITIDVHISLDKKLSMLSIAFWEKGNPSNEAMMGFIKEKLTEKVFEIQQNIIFGKMSRDDQKKICIRPGDLFSLIDEMVNGDLRQKVFSPRFLEQNTFVGPHMSVL